MGTDIGMIQDAYRGFSRDNYAMLDNLSLGYGKLHCRIKSRLTILLMGVHTRTKK